jgi:hypothetical protein
LAQWRGTQQIIERRLNRDGVELYNKPAQDLAQRREIFIRSRRKMSRVPFRQNPSLEGETRRKRAKRDEAPGIKDQAVGSFALALDYFAVDTTAGVVEVSTGTDHLVCGFARHGRQCDQLRMNVLQGRAGALALIFVNQQILPARILF